MVKVGDKVLIGATRPSGKKDSNGYDIAEHVDVHGVVAAVDEASNIVVEFVPGVTMAVPAGGYRKA